MTHRFALGVRQSFDKFGSTHTSPILHRNVINTIDPRNLEAIMKSKIKDYTIMPARKTLITVLFGNGLFATEGEDWRHSRALVRAGLNHFEFTADTFEKHSDALLMTLQHHDGTSIDFGQLISRYTLDLASNVLIGHPMETAGNLQEQFASDFTLLGRMARVLTIFIRQIPHLADLVYGRQFKLAQRRVFCFVDSAIGTARSCRTVTCKATCADQHGVIDGFLPRSDDDERIRSELLNLLLAGSDTVGIALAELFYLLARNPRVWTELRKEAETRLNGRLPDEKDLKSMAYLQWTIKEAIRMRPTLSVHAKLAIRDTVLPRGGGESGTDPLFVPNGTYVVYSNYSLYRNPAVFGQDVDVFRPERWATVKPATFEYLDFGAGPRHCPGKEMGWTMVAYTTVRIAQHVTTLSPADDRPWEEAMAFSFHNRHGVHLVAKR